MFINSLVIVYFLSPECGTHCTFIYCHNMYKNMYTYYLLHATCRMIFNSIFINKWKICYLHESIIDHYQNKTFAAACIHNSFTSCESRIRARDKLYKYYYFITDLTVLFYLLHLVCDLLNVIVKFVFVKCQTRIIMFVYVEKNE